MVFYTGGREQGGEQMDARLLDSISWQNFLTGKIKVPGYRQDELRNNVSELARIQTNDSDIDRCLKRFEACRNIVYCNSSFMLEEEKQYLKEYMEILRLEYNKAKSEKEKDAWSSRRYTTTAATYYNVTTTTTAGGYWV